MGKSNDLTGKRFGSLVVTKRGPNKIHPNGKTSSRWFCDCDCGKKDVLVYRQSLVNGKTTCGHIKKKPLKHNIYESHDDYTIVYAEDKSYSFIIDTEDIPKIKDLYWSYGNNGYIYNSAYNILLHRLIMNCLNTNLIVDHINRNKKDNRKANLRYCNYSENGANKGKQSNNTSGYPGISWNKLLNKWSVEINFYGKKYRLGNYTDINEAIAIRKKKEKELFKEFAPQLE